MSEPKELEEKPVIDKQLPALTFKDAIDDISECLSEADGEYIAEIHNKICSNKIKYIGDNLWTVFEKFI